MQFRRLLRGGKREYNKRGIASLFELGLWYGSRKLPGNVRSRYYLQYYDRDVDEYDVPIDPHSVTWVNTDEIEYKTVRERPKWASFARNLGSVKAGNWDLHTDEEFTSLHASFKSHFEDGVPWEQTELFNDAMAKISNGEYTLRMCTTKDEVLQRCSEIDELYEKIKEEGYKSQAALGEYDTKLSRLGNEIQVDIGRDGSLLFVEGRHRLSIAKILDIETVPVVVVCRHKEWMERLEECFRRGEHGTHPDWNNIAEA